VYYFGQYSVLETNESFIVTLYFPAAWKEAAVVPVFKRGNHAAVSNYRPVV
jgi:tRNA G37 N-methylase TrmD